MSEQATEAPVEGTEQREQVSPPEGEPAAAAKTYDEAYVKELRAEAAKYRTAAKQAQTEAEKVKAAQMTEAERERAAAKAEGAAEATRKWGERLARSEYLAAAAKKNPKFDAAQILEDLNLAKFIGEDGEPDTKAIKASVDRLVTEPDKGPPSYDGGARTPAGAPYDMNKLMREALGRS